MKDMGATWPRRWHVLAVLLQDRLDVLVEADGGTLRSRGGAGQHPGDDNDDGGPLHLSLGSSAWPNCLAGLYTLNERKQRNGQLKDVG